MNAYRYKESGLDNVYIEGVNLVEDDAGEECVTIPNINGLHMAIAHGIVDKRSAITGPELRFLRTEMGLTQAQLAAMVHREPLAVSRWERNEIEIDSNAEAIIRLAAIDALKLPREAGVREIAGWCVPSAETAPLRIDGSDPSNYKVAA
ncbi:helix-turn-helix domain-containing protein [Methylobacterium sp. W2]|uniref:helix-turn-helix domain-containing protein n=1 Tax=Methylobacterium sp. W2 TaxID=2598107 RepID=UPI001D0CD8C6|nr:transcriptional regulator [Methylobacterium sp. W2]MCC0808945.1 helix-turn-helix domain-containing protein [Methylobacterium sp. W2]